MMRRTSTGAAPSSSASSPARPLPSVSFTASKNALAEPSAPMVCGAAAAVICFAMSPAPTTPSVNGRISAPTRVAAASQATTRVIRDGMAAI